MKPFAQAKINFLEQDSERKWQPNLKDISTNVYYVLIMERLNFRGFLTKNLLATKLGFPTPRRLREYERGMKKKQAEFPMEG
jgi:hypothetical protein